MLARSLAAAALLGCTTAASLAQAPAAQAPAPESQKPQPAPSAAALSFDGSGNLQYPGTADMQMLDGGMIDLYFRAAWNPEGKGMPSDFQIDRCLFACAGDGERMRYAVYVLGDMEGLAIWNGESWAEVDVSIQPERWHHLAVLFSPTRTAFVVDGAPVGVAPIGPGTNARRDTFDLFIGSSASGKSFFYGDMSNFRVWRKALPLEEIAVASEYTLPVRPEMVACLSAYAEWTDKERTIKVVSHDGLAERLSRVKAESEWMKNVPWTQRVEEARAQASERNAYVIAYATRADGYDVGAAAMEQTSLASEWWRALGTKHPMLLLSATEKDPKPSGLVPGQCALMGADGKVLRVFLPLSPEFTNYVIESTARAVAAAAFGTDADLALAQAQRAEWRESSSLVSALERSAKLDNLQDATRVGVEYGLGLSKIRALTAAYQARTPFVDEQGQVEFPEAHDLYVRRALDLMESLPRQLEPAPDLREFAYLLWEGKRITPTFVAAAETFDFVAPMTSLDPILAVLVASAGADDEAPVSAEKPAGESAR